MTAQKNSFKTRGIMGSDDLIFRLSRINESLGQRIDTDVEKHISIRSRDSTLTKELRMDMSGGASPEHRANIVWTITEGLAKLKDHLRKKMKERGLDPDLVEQCVKGSAELSLIVDLANVEKHAGKARKTYSGKNPSIENISAVLRLTAHPGKPATAQYDPATGKMSMSGERSVVVKADVVDESGDRICDWEKMVEKGMEEWEGFLTAHGLTKD